MEGRYYESGGSRCEACGSDLGIHRVWTLVFSDDPPEVLESVRLGTINWAGCQHPNCGHKGGWLWPSSFLYVDIEKERAVCVTIARAAAQQIDLLRDALNSEDIRKRGLDTDRLRRRTRFLGDYRKVIGALEEDVESLELENACIEAYLSRSELSGQERVEALVRTTLDLGAVSIEANEKTPAFLLDLENYRSCLTGEEDERIPMILDQIIEQLRGHVAAKAKPGPTDKGDGVLATWLKLVRQAGDHKLAKFSFEKALEGAEREVLRLRLARLGELRSRHALTQDRAAPIDSRPALLEQLEAEAAEAPPRNDITRAIQASDLPSLREFLKAQPTDVPATGLRELEPEPPTSSAPTWIAAGQDVLRAILRAVRLGGSIPYSVFDPIEHLPLAKAFVDAELARLLLEQGQSSGAMQHVAASIAILEKLGSTEPSSDDLWIGRLQGVALERLGELQLHFGRLEESVEALRAARQRYESVGAQDGVRMTLRSEASIYLNLGQHERAEALLKAVVSQTAGVGRADEVNDLLNLTNTYRHLRPTVEVNVGVGTQSDDDAAAASEREDAADDVIADVGGGDAAHVAQGFAGGAGIRVSTKVAGHEDLSYVDILGSETIGLLFRALAVARLNNDADCEAAVLGRLSVVYAELGCEALANLVLGKLLDKMPIESAGMDAQIRAWNVLRGHAEEQDEAGRTEESKTTREEALQLADLVLSGLKNEDLVSTEFRGEKATLLESVGRGEEARGEYLVTIDALERTRGWMRDPENKKGLQSRRWRPYVRAARNALRLYATTSPQRNELLIEAWRHIQAGRSRALLDAVGGQEDGEQRHAPLRPAAFSEVVGRLPDATAILEYFLMPTTPGCAGSWSMMLIEPAATEPRLAWQQPDMDCVLAAKERLSAIADEFDDICIRQGILLALGECGDAYLDALEALSDVLIPPAVMEHLQKGDYRRLVIVADAYLHEVPFAALRPVQTGERCFLGVPSGGRGFEVIQAPSSSIFFHWTKRERAPTVGRGQRALIVVDPLGDLSKGSAEVTATLDHVKTELVEAGLAVESLLERQATPASWLEGLGRHALVIYFGHSVAGWGGAEEMALVMNDGSGAQVSLSAADLYHAAARGPVADRSLVVLASCSGGLAFAGGWDSDRELTGLSIAHLQGGCGAVIAASRPLLAGPTLVLLQSLVRHLTQGADASLALCAAQRDMSESASPYSHPHFWGFLAFMGDPEWRI